MPGRKMTAVKTTGGPSVSWPLGPGGPPSSPPPTPDPPTPDPPMPTPPPLLAPQSACPTPPHPSLPHELPGSPKTPPPDLPPPMPASITYARLSSANGGDITDNYCALCNDGGTYLVDCNKCGRSNCSICIPGLNEVEEEVLGDLEYHCPACHGRRSRFYGLWKEGKPLFPEGMEIASRATGGHGARIQTSSIAIVELILESLPKIGTPAQVLFAYLQGSFVSNPDQITHTQVAFDIDSGNIGTHQREIRKIVTDLRRGGAERIVLIVQTHSDQERGDLWYSGDGIKGESKSTNICDFFDVVVGPELRQYIRKRKYSVMFLAACGSVVNVPSALAELQSVAKKFKFSDAFAFSELGLDPQRVVPFINEFCMSVLITGHKSTTALPIVLSSSSTSWYTGLVHLVALDGEVSTVRLERSHHTRRPNGKTLPLQCPNCRCYRPWVVPSAPPRNHSESMVFRCGTKDCAGACEVPALEGFKPLAEDATKFYSRVL